jgi:hypothetical protein
MTRNDNNTKETTMNADQLTAKLQAFAKTLDINDVRVAIGTTDWDRNVVWLQWRAIGCDRIRSRACGLTTHGIRYIKKQMREVEASL